MPVGFNSELSRVVTSDGVSLEGMLFTPDGAASELPVSALMLVHGTGSHFYAAGVLECFANQAVEAGLTVLRINTRGHDLVSRNPGQKGSVLGGAAYETISDCRLDLPAWIEFLSDRGHDRIGLAGHSMGAVKALYTAANEPHPAVQGVIGISPPRFCHKRFLQNPDCGPFREDFQKAEDLVARGQGDRLMTVRQPLPMLITAEGFLAKYGPHDDYDYVKHLPGVRCPTLILIGSRSAETSPAFAGVPEDVQSLIAERPELPLSFELIDGADTAYSNCHNQPFHHAEPWLRRIGH